MEWGCISEPLCDLTNEILRDDNWNLSTLYSPDNYLIHPSSPLPDDIPFSLRCKLIVDLVIDPRGTEVIYMDDFVGLCVDIPCSKNQSRLTNAALLAIHSVVQNTVDKMGSIIGQERLPNDQSQN